VLRLQRRLVPAGKIGLLSIGHRKTASAEDVAEKFRPSPVQELSDQPMPEINPSGWASRGSVFVAQLQPLSGGPPIQGVYRLKRETPIIWEEFQPGVFKYGVVKREGADAACVIELWETLVVAMAVPWPGDRGPIRRGRRNPRSRDSRK